MQKPNIIAHIHGQYLAAAGKGLPDVHTSSEQAVQAKVAVPGHGVVLVTFERMKHKHGRSTYTWWAAKRVEATDEVRRPNNRIGFCIWSARRHGNGSPLPMPVAVTTAWRRSAGGASASTGI